MRNAPGGEFEGLTNTQIDEKVNALNNLERESRDLVSDQDDHIGKYLEEHGRQVQVFAANLKPSDYNRLKSDFANSMTSTRMPNEIRISNSETGESDYLNPRSSNKEQSSSLDIMRHLEKLDGGDYSRVEVIVKNKKPYTRGTYNIDKEITINEETYPAGTSFEVDIPMTPDNNRSFIDGSNVSFYNSFMGNPEFANAIEDNLYSKDATPLHDEETLLDPRFEGMPVNDIFNPGKDVTLDPITTPTGEKISTHMDVAYSDKYNSKSKGLFLVASSDKTTKRQAKPLTWNNINLVDPSNKQAQVLKTSMLANAVISGAYDIQGKGNTLIKARGKDVIAEYYEQYAQAVRDNNEAGIKEYSSKLDGLLKNYKNQEVRWTGTGVLTALETNRDLYELNN